MIDALNLSIQDRLLNPAPRAFGMSRMMREPSFGRHFTPVTSHRRDFEPENDREKSVIASLEKRRIQVGLYVFGDSVLREDSKALSFRALKGPGTISVGTPRPNWYPSQIEVLRAVVNPGVQQAALPDWKAIYPIARQAMRRFKDGSTGFEMEFESWTIAARPAIAVSEKCISCHNSGSDLARRSSVKLGQPIGGVLYAFRGPQ